MTIGLGVEAGAAVRGRAQLTQKRVRLYGVTVRGRDAALPGAAQLL